jgi:hypothetical protein
MRLSDRMDVLRRCSLRLWLLLVLSICFMGRVALAGMVYPPAIDPGYRDLYNLDFAGAHAVFQQYMAAHPEDPLPVASDAAAYLFGEFDRLHIIDVQLFADQSRFDHRSTLTPDPVMRRAFDDRAAQAERLADAALARNPKDVAALYVKACISGMQSDYALMIDKRNITALNYSKQSSALAKQVLKLDPAMYDAYLAPGVENYMLSLKWAPIRFLLGLTGSATNKNEGLRLLRLTAEKGHYLAPFARMMLAVAALRDDHPQEAKNILIALSKEYPRNSLYQREIARIRQ